MNVLSCAARDIWSFLLVLGDEVRNEQREGKETGRCDEHLRKTRVEGPAGKWIKSHVFCDS